MVLRRLKYHFMTKPWTSRAAVWPLTVNCVIIGTKFNNQTAENLAATSDSPPYVELYPSPPKLADMSGAKCQIWSYFTEQMEADA